MSCRLLVGLGLLQLVVIVTSQGTPPSPPPRRTTSGPTPEPCEDGLWPCGDGQCIPSSWRCDGKKDCRNGADEGAFMCAGIPCTADQMDCPSNRRLGIFPACIFLDLVCDGAADCEEGEDEKNCTTTCGPREFTCEDGTCISFIGVCDHTSDCEKGEDEKNCTYDQCASYQRPACHWYKCLNESQFCDGTNDCKDGFDELPEDCNNPKPKCESTFSCDNGNCIDFNLICNDDDDCGDKTDETGCENLGVNECANTTTCGLHQTCVDKLLGYECKCDPGFKKVDDKCVDIDECTEVAGACSQACENTEGGKKCTCREGYILQENNSTCKRDKENNKIQAFLIFANKLFIRQYNLETDTLSVLSDDPEFAYLADYDYRGNIIFYVDARRYSLNSMTLKGENVTKLGIHNINGMEGLAVDWVAKHLYYTSNRIGGIYVTNMEGKLAKILFKDKSPRVRGITLNPEAGYLYWTDWSLAAFIGRIGMDGSGFTKLITDNLFWPNGITYDNGYMWWCDAHLDRIEYSDMNGENRHVVRANLPHPYGLDVFEGMVYWTEWNVKKVEMADRFTGENYSMLLTTEHLPYAIRVVHPLKQPMIRNPCGGNNGGCSHLCLIAPGPERYVCACPDSFKLDSDGKTCQPDCQPGQFACGGADAKCIPRFWFCDGEVDCAGGEDEESCPERICENGYFECKNQTGSKEPLCVYWMQVCDTKAQCPDGSDENETMCSQRVCQPYQHQCTSGQCLPKRWACDEDEDCGDGSDEAPLNPKCDVRENCTDAHFACDNGKCIPKLWFCDWDDDCGDMSDEPREQCWANRTCPAGWRDCRTNYRCIPSQFFCDGDDNCRDGSDEENCEEATCAPGDFQCDNKKCIPLRWKCDLDDDCGDNSDEKEETCPDGAIAECTYIEWRCANTRCIRKEKRCDFVDHCGDNSDEENCDTDPPECDDDKFQCDSGHCIDKEYLCDGEPDCIEDGSDERVCPDAQQCAADLHKCPHLYICIDPLYLCDGDNDCGDRSDETIEVCKNQPCDPESLFRCQNQKCVRNFRVCDGVDDCGDGSDENNHTACGYRPKAVCKEDEFRCANNRCIDQEMLCDGSNDCGDNTDEYPCMKGNCAEQNITCSGTCTDVRVAGFICSCNVTFTPLKEDPKFCGDLNECQHWGNNCPQICQNAHGSHECSCYNNFKKDEIVTKGQICNADSEYATSILIATAQNITSFMPREKERRDIIYNGKDIIALAVDTNTQRLFWIDRVTKKVMAGRIPHTKEGLVVPQDLGVDGLSRPSSLDYDWYGRNLFIADSEGKMIVIARDDGKFPKPVVTTKNKPMNVAVNSVKGKMYWVEVDDEKRSGSLHMAYMNGLKSKTLFSDLGFNVHLAIDYYMDGRLFWVDLNRGVIESCNHDGTDRLVVFKDGLQKPISVDVFESSIYYGSQLLHEVFKRDKFGRGVNVSALADVRSPKAVIINNKLKQPKGQGFPRNFCGGHMCGALCVSLPAALSCVCPHGKELPSLPSKCDVDAVERVQVPAACYCKNGGTCIYKDTMVVCSCAEGYTGEHCEDKVVSPPAPVTTMSPQPPQPGTTTPKPEEAPSNVLKIVLPIVIIILLLIIVIVIIVWLMRSGRLARKSPSGRAVYRTGTPGTENASVSTAGAAGADPEVVVKGDGIENPMYENMQNPPAYSDVDTNHNAEPLPVKTTIDLN